MDAMDREYHRGERGIKFGSRKNDKDRIVEYGRLAIEINTTYSLKVGVVVICSYVQYSAMLYRIHKTLQNSPIL